VETGETANISYYSRRDVVSQILQAKSINPAAELFTDMRQFENFELKNVYDKNPYTFFWSNGFETGSYVTVSFRKPQVIKRIVVNTGSYINTDKLQNGILVAGQHFDVQTNSCKNLSKQWFFIDGYVDITEGSAFNNISCISIIAQSKQAEWLMLRDIIVEVFK
jgi:methionine salvage enolase-phosphatase E1